MVTKAEMLAGRATINGEDIERQESETVAQTGGDGVSGLNNLGRDPASAEPRRDATAKEAAVQNSQESLQEYLERSVQSLSQAAELLEYEYARVVEDMELNKLELRVANKALQEFTKDARRNDKQD